MRRRTWWAALWLMVVAPGWAAGTLDLTSDFVSEYIFRGASQRQGVSIQPSLRYEIVDDLAATLWLNLRMEGSIAFTETDYSLAWTALSSRPAAWTLGAIYYDRSNRLALPETTELYAGVDLDLPGSPSLYAFWDMDSNPGIYWSVAAGHRFLLPDYQGTIDLGASLGFDTGRLNCFQDARLSLGFTRHLGDWRIQPSVDLHFPAGAVDPGANGFRPAFRFSASRSF